MELHGLTLPDSFNSLLRLCTSKGNKEQEILLFCVIRNIVFVQEQESGEGLEIQREVTP